MDRFNNGLTDEYLTSSSDFPDFLDFPDFITDDFDDIDELIPSYLNVDTSTISDFYTRFPHVVSISNFNSLT